MTSEIVLLPAAAGDKQEGTQVPGSGYHYDKLQLKDNTAKYILFSPGWGSGWLTELYKFSPTIAGGQIESVTINYTCGVPGSAALNMEFVPIMKTYGVEHYGPTTQLPYDLISITLDGTPYVMTNNPYTSSRWSWSEVYAIQAGVRCRNPAANGWVAAFTYLEVRIAYLPDVCRPGIIDVL